MVTREPQVSSAFDEEPTIPFWLDGKAVSSSTTFDIHSPLNQSKLYTCSSSSEEDDPLAIDSVQKAFLTWFQTKAHAEREIFLRAADEYMRRKGELRHDSPTKTGASHAMFDYEHEAAHQACKDIAGLIQIADRGTLPIPAAERNSSAVLDEPYSIILDIAPWSALNVLGLRACLQPLAMYVFWPWISIEDKGNTVILMGPEAARATYVSSRISPF